MKKIDQPSSSENEQEEKRIKESSIDNKQEIEPPLITSNNDEFPLETPSIDVINVKEDDSTAATIPEENSLVIPGSEQDNNTVGDTFQSESSSQYDDTHQLLQTIADKSNKEPYITILNTLVESDFDLDKNYIEQKPKKFT
ncbi:unnamed protein product [Rotaria socialis]